MLTVTSKQLVNVIAMWVEVVWLLNYKWNAHSQKNNTNVRAKTRDQERKYFSSRYMENLDQM